MGRLKTGAWSAISGQVDNLVGAIVHDTNVLRKVPKKSTVPAVQSQIDQRLRFALITGFVRELADIFNIGYQSFTGNISPRNAAVSYHLKNAVTGVSPDYAIDFASVVLSKGNLPAVITTDTPELVDNVINISWTMDNLGSAAIETRGTDLFYAVFYCEEKHLFMMVNGSVARSAQTADFNVVKLFRGQTLHGWAFFVTADGKVVSTSEYLGVFKVPA